MTYAISAPSAGFNFTGRLVELKEQFLAAHARRADVRKAYAELQTLSDRELQEFGLHRSGLYSMALYSVNKG